MRHRKLCIFLKDIERGEMVCEYEGENMIWVTYCRSIMYEVTHAAQEIVHFPQGY